MGKVDATNIFTGAASRFVAIETTLTFSSTLFIAVRRQYPSHSLTNDLQLLWTPWLLQGTLTWEKGGSWQGSDSNRVRPVQPATQWWSIPGEPSTDGTPVFKTKGTRAWKRGHDLVARRYIRGEHRYSTWPLAWASAEPSAGRGEGLYASFNAQHEDTVSSVSVVSIEIFGRVS